MRQYPQLVILEPSRRHAGRGGSVSVQPSLWSDVVGAVDVLRRRAHLPTRGEAGLAMIRAGIELESAADPAVTSSRLTRRKLDLARALARDPAAVVLRGFFRRLDAANAAALMRALHEVAMRGIACYISAGGEREAACAASAVRTVFGAAAILGRSLKGPDTRTA